VHAFSTKEPPEHQQDFRVTLKQSFAYCCIVRLLHNVTRVNYDITIIFLLNNYYFGFVLTDRGIRVYSVDPGSVETPMYRHFPFLTNPILKAIQKPIRFIVVRSPFQGAQTVLHCALSPKLGSETGLYYA
jgi:hypothetical protein